jgi:hypothetical protein
LPSALGLLVDVDAVAAAEVDLDGCCDDLPEDDVPLVFDLADLSLTGESAKNKERAVRITLVGSMNVHKRHTLRRLALCYFAVSLIF